MRSVINWGRVNPDSLRLETDDDLVALGDRLNRSELEFWLGEQPKYRAMINLEKARRLKNLL